jgi:hypothetical protein
MRRISANRPQEENRQQSMAMSIQEIAPLADCVNAKDEEQRKNHYKKKRCCHDHILPPFKPRALKNRLTCGQQIC